MKSLVGSFKAIALDNLRCESLLADTTSLSGLVILLSNESPSIVLDILESDLKVIESQLLTIKGIISITFQLNKCRVIVMAVDAVEPEQILDKVTIACQQLASENDLVDTPGCFIRRQKSTCSRAALQRRDTVGSSCNAISSTMPPPRQLKTRQKLQPIRPYLADDADIFEVDPNHGVPQRRDAAVNDASGTSRGLGGWLSDLLERTIFW
ncbi:unnamed protein product [Taenia asiatica]|uniref:ACT domain-containing protein n=1 Tax=Taenia asiatica TaxID=60517 RepID=A0A0R3W362_TAEAS|nr:unnamed protein product [Taenia asiatica]